MYLSRIAINMHSYQTMRALDNPEILHGMVEGGYDGERKRCLWRLDELNGMTYLMLLSPDEPNLSSMAAQIGYENAGWESRNYSKLLNKIMVGSVWRFRLTANPTTAVVKHGAARGKVKAITINAHQREWLIKQGERNGFSLREGQFDAVRSVWLKFRKKGREVSILSVTFEGILTVTNDELFKNALISGIGRGKAYGQGLLTVMSYA